MKLYSATYFYLPGGYVKTLRPPLIYEELKEERYKINEILNNNKPDFPHKYPKLLTWKSKLL